MWVALDQVLLHCPGQRMGTIMYSFHIVIFTRHQTIRYPLFSESTGSAFKLCLTSTFWRQRLGR